LQLGRSLNKVLTATPYVFSILQFIYFASTDLIFLIVQDGDLFRQYRLRLHTTSLELKAHATRQQLKEMEAAKETASEQNRQATARLTDAVLSYVASTPSTAYALAAAAANSAVSYIPSSFQPFGAKPSETENSPTPREVTVLENSSEMNASEIIHTIHRESPQAEISAVSGSEAPTISNASELPETNSAESAGASSESSLTSVVDESALAPAAEESTPTSVESGEDETVAPLEPQPMCPCEWFIADDMSSRTRYFIIQVRDTFVHVSNSMSSFGKLELRCSVQTMKLLPAVAGFLQCCSRAGHVTYFSFVLYAHEGPDSVQFLASRALAR
jgi:hypothetical protein